MNDQERALRNIIADIEAGMLSVVDASTKMKQVCLAEENDAEYLRLTELRCDLIRPFWRKR